MFALPDEDAAEAATAATTHWLWAVQLEAAQAFGSTVGFKKLCETDPLTSCDGTPAGWDQFAQEWHEFKDLYLLGFPPAMHPQVLMERLPPGLRNIGAGWVTGTC